MASTVTMTLPPQFADLLQKNMEKQKKKGKSVSSDEAINKIATITAKQYEAQLRKEKREEKESLEQEKVNDRISKLTERFLLANQPAQIKMQIKAQKYWDKFVVKNKFFSKALDLLKQGLKGAGNFLVDLLKGLLFLSLFDPKGELAASLINMLVNVFTFAIDILAKMVPRIMDALFVAVPKIANALWEAFKKISAKIGQVVFEAFAKIFERIGKEFDIPFLKDIANWLREINPQVKTFVGTLILLSGILAKFGVLLPILKFLGPLFFSISKNEEGVRKVSGLIPKIFSWLSKGIAALWGVLTPLLPMLIPILAIAAAIASLVAVFIYAEEIVTFFEGLWKKFWKWFEGLGTTMKIIVGILAALTAPISGFILLIYGLAKAFQFLKNLDWEKVWEETKKGFSKLWKNLNKWFEKKIKDTFKMIGDLFDFISNGWERLKSNVRRVFTDLKGLISKTFSFENIKNELRGVIDGIFGAGFMRRLSDKIMEAFGVVGDFFGALVMKINPFGGMMTANFTDLMKANEIARKAEGRTGIATSGTQVYKTMEAVRGAKNKTSALRDVAGKEGISKEAAMAIINAANRLGASGDQSDVVQELQKLNKSMTSGIPNIVPAQAD
jgi:hypothetical protein